MATRQRQQQETQILYSFIRNNENAVNKINLGKLRKSIVESEFYASKKIKNVYLHQAIHQHRTDFIFTIVAHFELAGTAGTDKKPLIMTFIPTNNSHSTNDILKKQMFYIIKDDKSFFLTDKANFTFSLGNYNSIFSIAQTTQKYQTFADIIIARVGVVLKIQNGELSCIISNLLSLFPTLASKLADGPFAEIFNDPDFNEFKEGYYGVVGSMMQNNILKYDNTYELTVKDLSKILDKKVYAAKPLISVNPLIKFYHKNNIMMYSTLPRQKSLQFPKQFPSNDWKNFSGVEFVSACNDYMITNPDELKLIPFPKSLNKYKMFTTEIEDVPRKKQILNNFNITHDSLILSQKYVQDCIRDAINDYTDWYKIIREFNNQKKSVKQKEETKSDSGSEYDYTQQNTNEPSSAIKGSYDKLDDFEIPIDKIKTQ